MSFLILQFSPSVFAFFLIVLDVFIFKTECMKKHRYLFGV